MKESSLETEITALRTELREMRAAYEARTVALERRARRWAGACVALLVTGCVLAATRPAESQAGIRLRAPFAIVDERNRPLLLLTKTPGGAMLELRDSLQRPIMRAGVAADRTQRGVTLFNAQGVRAAALGSLPTPPPRNTPGNTFFIYDDAGNPAMMAHQSVRDGADARGMFVFSRDFQRVIELGIDRSDGFIGLEVTPHDEDPETADESEAIRLGAGLQGERGLQINAPSGQRLVTLDEDPVGGRIELFGVDGQLLFQKPD